MHESGVNSRSSDLERIEAALHAAAALCRQCAKKPIHAEHKAGGEPVTVADRAVNDLLLEILPVGEEGWLSEESADDLCRLSRRRVWVVDPLDGTKEFVAGLPEWCVSIALIEDGQAVAGGVCNPTTEETFVGSRETGIRCRAPNLRQMGSLPGRKPIVLASRSEVGRGEWDWLEDGPFEVRPMGSIAYKLALVAAGRADATWTFVPKSEWDIAAGVALVDASGGNVRSLTGRPIAFNQPNTKWEGLAAFSSIRRAEVVQLFENRLLRRA